MPTYTFTTKTPPVEPNQEDNFGGAVVDANRNALVNVGAGIQTSDITGTPLNSPITVTTGTTVNVPLNAVSVTLQSSAALRISESSTTTGYFVLPTAATISMDIARMASFFLKQDSGSCTVQFYFKVI